MRFEEARILTDDVHNVGSDDGLVVLSSLHLGQAEQLFDDVDQEALLVLLVCERVGTRFLEEKRRVSSLIAPEIDPIAQHRVFKLPQDHSLPSICRASLSVMIVSVSTTSRWVR